MGAGHESFLALARNVRYPDSLVLTGVNTQLRPSAPIRK